MEYRLNRSSWVDGFLIKVNDLTYIVTTNNHSENVDHEKMCFKYIFIFYFQILDEVQRILYYIRQTPSLGRAFKVTDELFDLSTMAMEYFKEHIEPTLPEITYFGAEFLDFATPFTSEFWWFEISELPSLFSLFSLSVSVPYWNFAIIIQ